MAPIGSAVYATLLINDGYLPGAMVLGHSLRDRGAKGKLVALVILDRLSGTTIAELKSVYDEVVPVKQIVNKAPANLYLMDRPDLISMFTKIQLWRQTQYRRIVYLDADMVVVRAPNELLTMDTKFAAVPDIGWPDCFNSGMLVLNPNMADYYALLALAERGISFDGADQGLLNMHFTDWDRLSFVYNCTPSANYQYVPAYRHFQSTIKMIHYIGKEKPWTLGRDNRYHSGVYGELLGRWWAVYDRHYARQETVYYSGNYWDAPRRVQDYVTGEQTIYLPAYQAPKGAYQGSGDQSQQRRPSFDQAQTGHAPAIHINEHPQGQPAPSMEQPMGDQPGVDEQIRDREYTPTTTVEQRRWSAPQVEWEPARAPPPTNSKPEAVNFPTKIYEFNEDKALFQPPRSYPEAPKGMWYEVPKKAASQPKPKPIFPWESNAPKPTRVFADVAPPSPPAEVFQPDPEPIPEPESNTRTTDVKEEIDPTLVRPLSPPADTWATFSQRTNAWDEMPEIVKYMQALNPPKRGKIQVLHHTPSTSINTINESSFTARRGGRRESLIITEFPSAAERPSLPVTPAPVRRPSFWGDDREEEGDMPAADGVPRQDEWVRRFSSYPQPQFAASSPIVHEENGIVCFRCQYCGKQNPIAKLDELQRTQSEALLGREGFSTVTEPPKRDMPESMTREDVVAATEKALSPPVKSPLKPILKEPSFEVPKDETTATTSREQNVPQTSPTVTIRDPKLPPHEQDLSPTSSRQVEPPSAIVVPAQEPDSSKGLPQDDVLPLVPTQSESLPTSTSTSTSFQDQTSSTKMSSEHDSSTVSTSEGYSVTAPSSDDHAVGTATEAAQDFGSATVTSSDADVVQSSVQREITSTSTQDQTSIMRTSLEDHDSSTKPTSEGYLVTAPSSDGRAIGTATEAAQDFGSAVITSTDAGVTQPSFKREISSTSTQDQTSVMRTSSGHDSSTTFASEGYSMTVPSSDGRVVGTATEAAQDYGSAMVTSTDAEFVDTSVQRDATSSSTSMLTSTQDRTSITQTSSDFDRSTTSIPQGYLVTAPSFDGSGVSTAIEAAQDQGSATITSLDPNVVNASFQENVASMSTLTQNQTSAMRTFSDYDSSNMSASTGYLVTAPSSDGQVVGSATEAAQDQGSATVTSLDSSILNTSAQQDVNVSSSIQGFESSSLISSQVLEGSTLSTQDTSIGGVGSQVPAGLTTTNAGRDISALLSGNSGNLLQDTDLSSTSLHPDFLRKPSIGPDFESSVIKDGSSLVASSLEESQSNMSAEYREVSSSTSVARDLPTSPPDAQATSNVVPSFSTGEEVLTPGVIDPRAIFVDEDDKGEWGEFS